MPRTKRPRCFREGCDRKRPRNHTYCTHLCFLMDRELDKARRITEATRDTAVWVAAVAFNDAFTAYQADYRRVYHAARDVGITDEQWREMANGAARIKGRL